MYTNGSTVADTADGSGMDVGSRYRTLWLHATGGLGEVFGAIDTELQRQVALKRLQDAHAQNPSSRERFVAEAGITGNLEHPGIVPVYGLGTGSDGRPYYAMRFVKGETLSSAIHRFHSGLDGDFTGREFRWLLRRFMDACNPVAYAHSRGILHRDLKPSNIMLGPFGETMVMDWGVAKVIAGALSRDTIAEESRTTPEQHRSRSLGNGVVTLDGHTVGTPAFMSPEQAAGRLDSLGPASDVYSLGATLYVLLTDQRPFTGLTEQILADVKQGRFLPPRTVKPALPPALEAICLRAMDLDPRKRYETALQLAEDIERWLADEAVTAWDDPWLDRCGRWVRRHKPIMAGAAAAAGMALLALGLAVPVLSLAWGNESAARRNEQKLRILAMQKAEEAYELQKVSDRNLETARRERAAALASETHAKEEQARARKTLEFLVAAFRKPDPALDGRSLKVVDLLDRAVRELNESFRDQPLMEATILSAIGQTFGGLGMPEKSLPVLERAVALRGGTLGEDDPETMRATHYLAMAFQDAGRYEQAIILLERTLARRKGRQDPDPTELIESLNDLAVAYWESGQPARAVPLYEAALERIRGRLGDAHADTLTIVDNLAVAYVASGEAGRAIPLHESVLQKLRDTLGEDHLTTLVTMNNLARAYEAGLRHRESIELYERTVPKLRVKLSDDHPTVLTAMCGMARAYQSIGRLSQAIGVLEVVLMKRRVKLGDDHPETLMTLFELASAYSAKDQHEKGLTLVREFRDRTQRAADSLPAKVRETIPQARKLFESLSERVKFLSP